MKNIIFIYYWSVSPYQLSIITDVKGGNCSNYEGNYEGIIGNILLFGAEIGGYDYSLVGVDDVSTSDFKNYDTVGLVG